MKQEESGKDLMMKVMMMIMESGIELWGVLLIGLRGQQMGEDLLKAMNEEDIEKVLIRSMEEYSTKKERPMYAVKECSQKKNNLKDFGEADMKDLN